MADPTENGGTPGDEKPKTLAERTAEASGINATVDPDDVDSLFPEGYLDGDPWTLAKVHKASEPINVKAALSRAEVPMRSGLPDPTKRGRAVVSYARPTYNVKPAYEEVDVNKDEITEYNIVATLKVSHVEPITNDTEFLLREFERFIAADRQAACELADTFVQMANGGEA